MKKLLILIFIVVIAGCTADDGSSSYDTEYPGPNNILTGSWTYTYSITSQRTDEFTLDAADGAMTGYFTNTHFGDYLTLYGNYTDVDISFIANNFDENIRYRCTADYTNNTMTGTIIMKNMAGEILREFDFTAVKQ